jgi:hypothetical protein
VEQWLVQVSRVRLATLQAESIVDTIRDGYGLSHSIELPGQMKILFAYRSRLKATMIFGAHPSGSKVGPASIPQLGANSVPIRSEGVDGNPEFTHDLLIELPLSGKF